MIGLRSNFRQILRRSVRRVFRNKACRPVCNRRLCGRHSVRFPVGFDGHSGNQLLIQVLEIGGHLNLVFPVMLTAIISYLTTVQFSSSYIFTAMELSKMFYLPKLFKRRFYGLKASDVSKPPKFVLYQNSSIKDFLEYFF